MVNTKFFKFHISTGFSLRVTMKYSTFHFLLEIKFVDDIEEYENEK